MNNALQAAYNQFANKNFVGTGAGREEIGRAFREEMKRIRDKPIGAVDPNDRSTWRNQKPTSLGGRWR